MLFSIYRLYLWKEIQALCSRILKEEIVFTTTQNLKSTTILIISSKQRLAIY